MRLGQQSWIDSVSRFGASTLGFLATLYIARLLGPDPLGTYHLAIGLVSWLSIGGKFGVSGAITKRVSENKDQGEYAVAGISIVFALFTILAIGTLLGRSYLNSYVGYPVTGYIILLLLVLLVNGSIGSLLTGLHLVHVRGILATVRTGLRSTFQIILVFGGFSTAGLFIGHIFGFLLAVVIGSYVVYRNLPQLSLPRMEHYTSLFDFAKYSWLGTLQNRMFNYTDIIVLGFFVSQTLIGIYAVAWNIGRFLTIFSGSLRSTLFPEISMISTKQNPQAVSRIVEQSLTYAGLFLIPGLFGGALIGERLLQIYGPEFPQGSVIFVILILANLIQGYRSQLVSILNGIDRPDLAFRVNAVFIVSNLALNVILIYLFSWVGAAVATATSVGISLLLGYYHVEAIINFQIPFSEIGKQWFAAIVMAGLVFGGLWIENTFRILGHNFATVLILVLLGTGVYFLVLVGISREFRETVERNTPFKIPMMSR